MKVPLSWLREYAPVRASAEEVAERLVNVGFEIDGIRHVGAPDAGANHEHFRIGRVLDFVQHPNADRLRLAHVDVGEEEARQIVCGAANFREGDTVVVAVPGAVLPGADRPLKRAKLRGEVSDGMMLSERELELSNEHDGIMVLTDGYEVGSLLRDHLDLADAVLDVDITSNRGDCLSIYGLAREVAAAFDVDLAPMPGVEPEATGSGHVADLVRVGIEAPERCYRFVARGFQDVTIGPSSLRMRARLAAAGMRPISNVVDITNYVMIGLGNPLHAYDATRIAGGVLTARMARENEVLTTLDGRERRLSADMLVIADADGPSGVAGIMGGEHSEISGDTSTVVIEAANFERAGIMRTARTLALRTEGSNRWEKGVDPYLADQAARWAAELMVEAGARAVPGTLDEIALLPGRDRVVLRDGRVRDVTGVDVPVDVARHALGRLGFEPERADGGLATRIPTWRRLDTTREIDLVEEVARLHGLDHVPVSLPSRSATVGGGLDPSQRRRRQVADALAGAGLHELQTITLVELDEPERYGLDDDDARRAVVTLANPLTAEYAALRTSLVPSLLRAVRSNRAVGRVDVHVFETSHTYHPRPDAPLPHEPWRVAAVLAGRLGGSGWHGAGPEADAFVVKGVLEVLLGRLGVEATYEPVRRGHLHPGRAARVLVGGDEVGELGELHPRTAERFDVAGRVALFELDLDALLAHVPPLHRAPVVPDLPPVRQDIAVVVAADVPAAQVLTVAREAGGDLLRDAAVFDVYRDAERLGPDRVSLAVRLTFRADDRTLTEDEASVARIAVVDALRDRLGAELRGS